MDYYNAMGKAPPMPSIKGGEHILHHLNALGWCSSTGMGITALSFTEIKAYSDLTETPLNSDEVMLIRNMSKEYCTNVQNKDPSKQAPYSEA